MLQTQGKIPKSSPNINSEHPKYLENLRKNENSNSVCSEIQDGLPLYPHAPRRFFIEALSVV